MSPTAAPPRRRASTDSPPPRRRPGPTTRPARTSASGSITSPRTRPRPPVRSTPRATTSTTGRVVTAPARVAPRNPVRRRVKVLALSSVAVVIVLTIVAFHVYLAQTQLRVEQLRGRIAVAEARYEAQRLENGQLASPARITGRAAELGLVVPSVAPVAVPVVGRVPGRSSSSSTVTDWSEVKRHLDASP